MPWGAAVAAGGSILSGVLGGNASSKAAEAQTRAAQQALQFQSNVYSQGQTNLNPYIQGGSTSLQSLMGLLGLGGSGQNANAQSAFQGFTQTPAYQFPLQQGNLALNRQLASAGLTSSGGALKDAIGYNQGFASQGLNSYMGQLAGLAGSGQNAAGALAGFGNTASQNIGGLQTYTGNAQGNGLLGQAAGLNKAVSGGIAPLIGQNNGGIGGPNSPIGQAGGWLQGLLAGSNPTPYTPGAIPAATNVGDTF